MKKAVIVLPTFNERQNIQTLIPAIFAVTNKIDGWDFSILVVDDNSPDNTYIEVEKLKKTFNKLYLLQGKKRGLGKAYTRGFNHALSSFKPDLLFEMDADWSHPPALISDFISKIDSGADFVIGSRYIKGGSIPSDWGLHRKIFSYLGNIVIRLGFMNRNIHEWTNGYRAIRASFVKKIIGELDSFNGYVFQIAILDRAIKNNLKIVEVPVHFKERKSGESKISSFRYIFDILSYIVINSPFVRFAFVGLSGAMIDFGISFVFIEIFRQTVWLSTLVSTEGAIVYNFVLNNFWTFSHKKIEHSVSSYLKNFANFNLVSAGSVMIQTLGMHLSTEKFGQKNWYLHKIFILAFIIIPYSYFMYNKFIWKGSKDGS